MRAPAFQVVENNPYVPQPFVLTEIATCLRDAIEAAGYDCIHVCNRLEPGRFAIVLGGNPELERQLGLDRRTCAIFNFEQLASTSNLAGPEYRHWLRDWLVLDYHDSNVQVLLRENAPLQEALELPVVPGPSVRYPVTEARSNDVLFYGTLSEHRQSVIDALRARGLSVEVVAGAYGRELSPAVQRARLVLHAHYYDQGLFPVARVLQPVMMGVPVVCEASVFSRLNDWSASGILFAPREQLVQACVDLLGDPQACERRAQAARAFAARIDFATPFAAVVRAMQRRASAPARAPVREEERVLTTAEIEALLAEEAAQSPEAGQAAPELQVVRREPGQGVFGKWIAWLLILFIVLGVAGVWKPGT